MIRVDQSFVKKNLLQAKMDKGMNFFSKANKMYQRFFDIITGTDKTKMLVNVKMLRTNWIFRSRKTEIGEQSNFNSFI